MEVDHIEFWVSSAKVTAFYWQQKFGFTPYATKRKGDRVYYTIAQGKAIFTFVSSTAAADSEFHQKISRHAPYSIEDEHGSIRMAQIAPPFGDLVHTLIDRSNYAGFLPSFVRQHEPTSTATPTATPTATSTATSTSTGITHIDHIAIAFEKGIATRACEWYCKAFGFHQFFINTREEEGVILGMPEEGGLKTFFASCNEAVNSETLVFVEAVEGTSGQNNQIQQFLEYNSGAGVQHVALHSNDIIDTVSRLKQQGVDFVAIPDTYYDLLFRNKNPFVQRCGAKLKELGILADVASEEEEDILLQIFTTPLYDRPTFFLEVISRLGNCAGFGEKTIKTLFEAVEKQRKLALS